MHHFFSEFHHYNPFDFLTIGTLIVLEGLLSVDNALVLATIVRKLPKAQQRKALTFGVWGAIVFRIAAILLATYIIQRREIKLIGGAYLVYLAFRHMFPSNRIYGEKQMRKKQPSASFWGTVAIVEMTDVVFSVDSIATAVAMTDKTSVIMIGGIAGLVAMRFVAMAFIKLLEKFPHLDDIAYQLIFFIGIKLALGCFDINLEHSTFWLVVGLIVLIGISSMYQERISEGKGDKTTSALITSHDEEYLLDIAQRKMSIADLFESDNQFSADFIRYLIKNGYLTYTRKAILPDIKKASDDVYASKSIDGSTSGDSGNEGEAVHPALRVDDKPAKTAESNHTAQREDI